jgi:hypothetical protein
MVLQSSAVERESCGPEGMAMNYKTGASTPFRATRFYLEGTLDRVGHADGPIAFYGHDFDVDGERIHVYPLGTRYWTWVEVERGSERRMGPSRRS